MKNFDTFGVMIDCSRNSVMTVPALKKFIDILVKFGYNQVQLYTEDTYEVDGEEFFGYFRGRYTQAELKELDDYAFERGVELVPCIQTLAHMNAAIRWPKYGDLVDTADILLVGDDRTYALIENMFSSLRKCFRTKRIHIGMDEAHGLGTGRYKQLHGERDKTDILLEHLNKVCDLADKYGFEPMMWSDMFYRIAAGGEYYASGTNFSNEIAEKIPAKLSLVYWDYYHTSKQAYASMIRGHKQLTNRVVFAGGAWRWVGFTPHNDYSFRIMKAAFPACIEGGVRDAFITMWGDDGGETSVFSLLPSLCYAACLAEGITDSEAIRARFKEVMGYDFELFRMLDLPDKVVTCSGVVNPSKYLLYSDCFMGIMDSACESDYPKKYATFARRLKTASKKAGEFAYLFDSAAALCKLMSIKCNIGNVSREMYRSKDPEKLAELIKMYNKMIRAAEEFYKAFRTLWYTDYKPHGFDVQDIRLGGMIFRMKNCRDRLVSLQNGEIDNIPELDEDTLQYLRAACCYNSWKLCATANVL